MQERIKQLAVESGLVAFVDFDGALVTERDDQTAPIIRFAQAVARDVVALYYEHSGDSMQMPGIDAIRARFNITE